MGIRKLPPELISLVHHVELNEAGWWDKAVQQLIVATIWRSGESLTAQAVLDKLADHFSVNLDADRVRNQIDALCAPGTLVALPGEKFKISEQSLAQFTADLGEAQKIQEEAEQRFIDIVRDCCPSVQAEAAWRSFNEGFLVPLIRDMGARTYELISGATIDFAAIPRVQEFLEGYSTEIRAPLLRAVVAFMDPKDANVRSYILRQLSAYFLLEAGNLSEETVRALTTMLDTTPTFTVFVDTNFLFCILGLDENPRNEAAQGLIHLVGQLTSKVAVKLYVSPITIDEARWVLQSCVHDLSDLRLPPNLADPALTSGLSGLTRKFAEECSRAGQPLRAKDYFGPYIKDLVGIARGKGVELSSRKVDQYRTSQEVVDDLNEQLEFEKRFRDRPKGYKQLEHDIVLWHFVRDQRPASIDSPVEADCWIVTVDFRFLGFDRHKRRNQVNNIPICVHPANFIQMLQFWVPRTQEFEEAVLGNLRLPLLFQEFDPGAEQLTIRILSALARFEKIDDLPQEVVASTLMNRALRQRLEAEPDQEKGTELVREALIIQEDQRVREQLNAEQAKTVQLEREARDKDETIAELQRQEKGRKEAVKESQRRVEEERVRRGSLEQRLATVEGVLQSKRAQDQLRRFALWWAVAPLALIVALGLGIAIPLASFTAWDLLRSALTALGVCSTLLIVWLWLAESHGSADPVVSQWAPFAKLRTFKVWLFGVLGAIVLGLVVKALWQAIAGAI